MQKPENYKDKLDNLYTRHYLALERADFIYPLHENNIVSKKIQQEDENNEEDENIMEDKNYEEQYEEVSMEMGEINRRLVRLEENIKKDNKELKKNNHILKNILDEKKNDENKMNSKNNGFDDTERALIQMKNDYKKRQSETFIKAVDMTLGIILVCFLIYKKSK